MELIQQPKRKRATVVEEPKALTCRGHNQLHMCFNCKDDECKSKGFFKMHRCKNLFVWIAGMASLLILFITMIAIYMIVRIVDGNWSDPSLPLALLTGYIAFALAVIIVISTLDYKHRTGDAIYE